MNGCSIMARSAPDSPTVISLFTGVGGIDFGLEAAGFETAVALEFDSVACATLRLNREWPVIGDDIHDVTSADILKVAGLRAGQVDLLVGGPPCQPFSKSGYWKTGDARRLDDPRAGTLSAYLRVLRDVRPRAFLLENVPGMAFAGKDDGLAHLLEGIEEINRQAQTSYRVAWKVINAADFGVPQARERVFLVGARDGAAFSFPTPTHFSVEESQFGKSRFTTAWDALGDLPADGGDKDLEVRGKWADLLPTIPEGQNYLWHTARGGGVPLFGWRTRYWSFLLKLAKDRPAWTIQAQPGPAIGPFHWNNRRLSIRELCRLQTFPERLRFDCARNEAQRLLGNAVPSLLTEVLGREIRRQLLGHTVSVRKPKLLPLDRGTAPRPEPVAPVPAAFQGLIGEHADHPGEGLGSGAVRRSLVALGT
jgi:DNA (cytosine-5)-methyltransferase 1